MTTNVGPVREACARAGDGALKREIRIAAAIHATLLGVVAEAALQRYAQRRSVPAWLSEGLRAGPWRDGSVLDPEAEPAIVARRQAAEPT